MTRPVVGNFAEELYATMAPLAALDEANDWGLLRWCGALGEMLEEVYDLAMTDGDGNPGWSALMDLERCPEEALPYLAQFVGVRFPRADLTVEQMRLRIAETDGWKRGSVAGVQGAAAQYLIGDRKVILRERYDPSDPLVDHAYHLTVFTFTDETPDPDAVERALLEQKPAGIILHYEVRDGQDWTSLNASEPTWTDVSTTYSSWADVAGTY